MRKTKFELKFIPFHFVLFLHAFKLDLKKINIWPEILILYFLMNIS